MKCHDVWSQYGNRPMAETLRASCSIGGTKSLWPQSISDEKRVCPMKEKSCYGATFDNYRAMLAHCRKHHPDTLPFGGDPTTELVVTDTEGNVLSLEEIRQILDDPSFWQEPLRVAQREDEADAPLLIRRRERHAGVGIEA
jgi:hypothetical protein